MSEREKVQVIYELRCRYSITSLIKVAKIARSTYYYHLKSFNKPDKYAEIKELILEIWDLHKGRYGYRRIKKELNNKGIIINNKTVQKLMKILGLKCQVRMKKYKFYKGNIGKVAPNIINRDFKAEQPYKKWVTDVTEFSLFGEKLYLSPILDLYNGEIISYSLQRRPTFDLITTMLDDAIKSLPASSSVSLHSDQGWQYQMKKYQKILKDNNITQSMSRKGNCLDNSVIENFFGILKTELFYLHKFDSVENFIDELHNYIYYYNNYRIKLKLKGLSPVVYRTQSSMVS